jgi:hypothetical protein
LAELKGFGEWSCDSLQGDLWIEDTTDVVDLEVLTDLTNMINGGLTISNNEELTSVRGLRNMRGVVLTGYVWIQSNAKLGSLDGLEGIIEIGSSQGDSLYISSNAALISISGLGGVRGVLPGALKVMGNSALVSLKGLEGVTGFSGYEGVGYSIYIEGNTALRSVAALNNAQGDLPGALVVWDNPLLESVQGLHGFRAAGTVAAWQGSAVMIKGNTGLCATPSEISALRTMCETSAGYGIGDADSCGPASDAEWWDPDMCKGKLRGCR